ncbi:glycosyltransferase family 2 protein [Kluyvera ascorbata]|uniref:glycosyltransferase family 2 protein n=1 Tax=Kluyvera ascorbata TaxID=51288 RepID=UPI0039F52937
MRVTIITATYNSQKTIRDTLLSLERQSYHDIEYIVVDGASTDSTLEIIKNTSSRVSTIISEPDKGIYDALNKGIKVSSGDVIGFLHSDDLFAYDDAVKDLVEAFQLTGRDAIYGDLEYVSYADVHKRIRLWKSGYYNRIKIKLGWMPPHPAFYMKRSCYDTFGGFSLKYRISADYDSLLRYILKNKVSISYLSKIIVKMRVGGISNRSLSSMFKKSSEDIQIMKNNNLIWPLALALKNLSKLPQFFKK